MYSLTNELRCGHNADDDDDDDYDGTYYEPLLSRFHSWCDINGIVKFLHATQFGTR